jgi:hypothetical protein
VKAVLVTALALLALAPQPALAADAPGGCRLLAARNASPLASGACTGVRPGAVVETPIGFCTMNFAFRGRKRVRYIGTAGHCIIGESGGEQVWKRRGPVAKDIDGKPIGRFAYGVLDPYGEDDFSLIRLNKGIKPNPAICHFGGPTGINRDLSSRPQGFNFYGRGVAVSSLAPARQIFALNLTEQDHVVANGIAVPGDSGGPVTSRDGRAVGLLVSGGVWVGAIGTPTPEVGTVDVIRLGPQVDRAASMMSERLRLLTAPTR